MPKPARSRAVEPSVVPIRGRKKGGVRSSAEERKTKPVAPNAFRLGYLIHDVSRMRRRLLDHRMKPDGITRSQWWVLANLSRHGADGIVTTELAKLLDIGKVTLGGLIDRLESAGYVYRRPDKQDRRAKQVFISDKGYALIDYMRGIVAELNGRICEALTEQEVAATELYLIRLKDRLRELLAEAQVDAD